MNRLDIAPAQYHHVITIIVSILACQCLHVSQSTTLSKYSCTESPACLQIAVLRSVQHNSEKQLPHIWVLTCEQWADRHLLSSGRVTTKVCGKKTNSNSRVLLKAAMLWWERKEKKARFPPDYYNCRIERMTTYAASTCWWLMTYLSVSCSWRESIKALGKCMAQDQHWDPVLLIKEKPDLKMVEMWLIHCKNSNMYLLV